MIRKQVKLPLSVAFDVVLQGFRIRLGRSLVTMMGVALGVAFLMSILTASLLRQGVSGEVAVRFETQRMLGFLQSEAGRLEDRVVAVWQTGPLEEAETRFLQSIGSQKPSEIRVFSNGAKAPSGTVGSPDFASILPDAAVLLVMGSPADPASLRSTSVLPAELPPVMLTRKELTKTLEGQLTGVNLERDLREDEIARAERDARLERVRTIWIVSISLLVTLIGITNSLLMSVTERFREIGTMKCLGALSSFIRRIFFIESTLIGIVGGILGALSGFVFSLILYAFTYGPGLILASIPIGPVLVALVGCTIGGVVCSVLAAIYPAGYASRMVPATALRTNV